MADPAIEAGRRAWAANEALDGIAYNPGEGGIWSPDAMEAAAREALKPIREWHRQMADAYALDDRPEGVLVEAVLQDLAKLIYSTEELMGGAR